MPSQLEISFTAQRAPRSERRSGASRRRLRVAAAVAVCAVVGFGLYGQLAQNRRLDDDVAALAAQNARLQRDISESRTEIVLAQTPAWLEEQARRLGYVLPGEKVYVLTTPGAAIPASGGVAAPLPVLPTPTPSPTATAAPTFAAAAASPSPQASPSPGR
jgi:cell division protein FtsB